MYINLLIRFCFSAFGINIWLKVDVKGKNTYLYSAIRHEGRDTFRIVLYHWIH